MATRLTIETAARTELQEATAGFWAATELHGWYDEAHAEIVARTKQEATSQATLVNGTESYSLPADFYMARRVEVQMTAGSNTSWTQVQPYNLDLRRPGDPLNPTLLTGVPSGYYIFANRIYFIPLPDSAYVSTMYYYKNATASTSDSDTPSYPEGIAQVRVDGAIKLYIVAQALRKRQDQSYTTYANDYNAAVDKMASDAGERGSATPPMAISDWWDE